VSILQATCQSPHPIVVMTEWEPLEKAPKTQPLYEVKINHGVFFRTQRSQIWAKLLVSGCCDGHKTPHLAPEAFFTVQSDWTITKLWKLTKVSNI
jgi:hypothetical protein